MKVSILTPAKNSCATIADTLASIDRQTHPEIEHIVMDAESTDGTAEVLERHRASRRVVLRGKDRSMYDAINKGLAAATGDVVAVLNSDDVYTDPGVIADVVRRFEETGADTVYGNIVYVRQDDLSKVVRYWRSGQGTRRDLEWGWTPPHTAFFIRKRIHDHLGGYDINYRIASDYEITLRLLYANDVSSAYLDRLCTRMRLGGMSNRDLPSLHKKSSEDLRACRQHGMPFPAGTVLMKNLRKLGQFVERGA